MKISRAILALFVMTAALCRGAEEEHKPAKTGPVRVEEGAVIVSADAQKRNGFQFAEIKPVEISKELSAFGTIVDPAPLLLLETELNDAEAATLIASNQLQRARTLFQDDQTVSRRTLETAENQLRIENTRREVAQRRIAFEWGNMLGSGTNAQALAEQLLTRKSSLARVELPIGQHLPSGKFLIRLRQAGSDKWLPSSFVGFATAVDARAQGESFFAKVENPPATMRPGAAIEARIADPAAIEKGSLVPAAAILRYLGEHWIYIKEGPERFEKKQIALERRENGGWFTKTLFEANTSCVVEGAASLLSAELQAAFGGEPE
jgi:multidrug efflux system membrane fusion protein